MGALAVEAQFLQGPSHADRPSRVAEVAAELAEDRGDGEDAERHAPRVVEPICGVDEPDHRHLAEVVVRLAATAVAVGKGDGQAEVVVDNLGGLVRTGDVAAGRSGSGPSGRSGTTRGAKGMGASWGRTGLASFGVRS